MITTLKKSLNVKIWFIVAILLASYFLIVGTPFPPGYVLQAGDAYLRSLPGYADIATGVVTQQQIEQNGDVYISYLLQVIVFPMLAVVICYLIFVIASVLIWNYIITSSISLRGLWRSIYSNLLVGLVTIVLGGLSYAIFFFIGSFGMIIWPKICTFLFALSILYLLMLLLVFNYHLQKSRAFVQSLILTAATIGKSGWKLFGFAVIVWIASTLVSFLSLVPAFYGADNLLNLLLVIAMVLALAWLHTFIGATITADELSMSAVASQNAQQSARQTTGRRKK